MNKLSLAYFGSPDFSARFLEKILNDKTLPVEVKLVVTQPDRPVGREQIITSCPVKKIAEKYNIRVYCATGVSKKGTPTAWSSDIKSERTLAGMNLGQNLLRQLDLALVYAYGEIIPAELLSLPKLGFWNIHPSLLPKYRGPTPIATPLINGDTETGVSLIQLTDKIDAGPIINQKKLKIDQYVRRPDLSNKLSDLAYDLFSETIKKIPKKYTPQDEQSATFTKLFNKEMGYISIDNLKFRILNSPKQLFNLFRALYPWPGIWTVIKINGQEKRLKITDVDFIKGKFIIKKTQLEGKKEADFRQFNAYYKVFNNS